jgi:hypothetical protein
MQRFWTEDMPRNTMLTRPTLPLLLPCLAALRCTGFDIMTPFDVVVLFMVWFAVVQRFKWKDILFIAFVVLVMMELPYSQSYIKRFDLVDKVVHAFNAFYYSQVSFHPHLLARAHEHTALSRAEKYVPCSLTCRHKDTARNRAHNHSRLHAHATIPQWRLHVYACTCQCTTLRGGCCTRPTRAVCGHSACCAFCAPPFAGFAVGVFTRPCEGPDLPSLECSSLDLCPFLRFVRHNRLLFVCRWSLTSRLAWHSSTEGDPPPLPMIGRCILTR